MTIKTSLFIIVFTCVFNVIVHAQFKITGIVIDRISRTPIAQPKITLRINDSVIAETSTNCKGWYTFKNLKHAIYSIEVKLPEEDHSVIATGIKLKGKSRTRRDFILLDLYHHPGRCCIFNIPPLTDAKKPGGRHTKTGQQLEKMPL